MDLIKNTELEKAEIITYIEDRISQKVEEMIRYYAISEDFMVREELDESGRALWVSRSVSTGVEKEKSLFEPVQGIFFQGDRIIGIANRRKDDEFWYSYQNFEPETRKNGGIIKIWAHMDIKGQVCNFELGTDGTCILDEKRKWPVIIYKERESQVVMSDDLAYSLDHVLARAVNPWPAMGLSVFPSPDDYYK